MKRLAAVMVVVALGFFVTRWAQGKVTLRLVTFSPNAQEQAFSLEPLTTKAVGLHLIFGVTDKEPTNWSGEISVSPGRLLALWGWRLGAKMTVEGNRFFIRSRFAGPQQKQIIAPELFATLEAPEEATIRVISKQGGFSFTLRDLSFGQPCSFLDGRVLVERIFPTFQLTRTSPAEEDFPSAVSDAGGNVWLAFVTYTPGGQPDLNAPLREEPKDFLFLVPRGGGDQIWLAKFDGKVWSSPLPVTEAGLDVWKPTVAVDGQGGVWVIWSQNFNGNWDLVARRFDPNENRWEKPKRLTNEAGADINGVAATDAKGKVWVAWQGWRKDNFDIWLMPLDGKPVRVSFSPANDWSPSLVVLRDGRLFVAYDTYDKGNYDVWLAEVQGEKVAHHPVATTRRFEARPHLAVDLQNRVWIAYEEGDVSWGKDFAGGGPAVARFNKGAPLYLNRTVRVKCWADGKLQAPLSPLRQNFPKQLGRPISHPRLGVDEKGRLWLLFRHATNLDGSQENWSSYAVVYDGEQWSAPLLIANSVNIMDVRPTLALAHSILLAFYASDKRPAGTGSRSDSDLFAVMLSLPGKAKPVKLTVIAPDEEAELPIALPARRRAGQLRRRSLLAGQYEPQEVVHPDEPRDIARLRQFRLQLGGKTYRLLRGEFHRHTELTAHRDQDGTLEDAWRYALDAAAMDWMGLGDHDNGYHHEYLWWLSQKLTDIFHHPPHFVTVFTYERSVSYPSGHRNVLFAQRGIRPLPRLGGPQQPDLLMGTAEQGSPDVKMLYRYLREFNGICASHTSATNMGTDWRDNDPVAEPVVEIYQGHRQNYEHLGAPRSATHAGESIGGWQPFGFVWNAFAKGYKLGFQCSSDHVSTHISYAIVFTESPTRQDILDAFRKRHSYGATDNILLVVTAGEHLMGDAFTSKEPIRLDIYAVGTASIARVHILKDFRYVYTVEPKRREVRFRWQDNAVEKGRESWYYVRVEQEDGQLAWSSPIWVKYEP